MRDQQKGFHPLGVIVWKANDPIASLGWLLRLYEPSVQETLKEPRRAGESFGAYYKRHHLVTRVERLPFHLSLDDVLCIVVCEVYNFLVDKVTPCRSSPMQVIRPVLIVINLSVRLVPKT